MLTLLEVYLTWRHVESVQDLMFPRSYTQLESKTIKFVSLFVHFSLQLSFVLLFNENDISHLRVTVVVPCS